MNREKKSTPGLADLNDFVLFPEKRRFVKQDSFTEEVYQNNLDALSEHHPELVAIVESLPADEARISVFDSESGNPRIVCTREDGEEINIHSVDDPIECANRAIDLLGNIEKEGIVVLFGFGLGYFAEEIFTKFEKGHILLIYEASKEVFKTALRVKDFSPLFRSDRVKIILGEDADNFSVIHNHHHLIVNGKFWVVRHEPSVKLDPEAYDNFFKRLNEEKSLSDMGIATHVRRGREFMNAFLFNLHSIIRKPGVIGLKDIFKGCAAIVVSAGPSLDKNIHLLRKAKGRAVIIATGGALPSLIGCDIIPDLVVEVDPVTENIEDKFQENPELKCIPFLCLAQYTPELIDIYPGPLFINSTPANPAFQWVNGYWEDKGVIECFGGSVAHLAFAAAEYIGADVIVLVGQDLSYKNERIHTAGYSDDLDRSLEAAAKIKQENVLGGIPMRDIFGEEVLSIRQFITFKTSFENRIKSSQRKVINATEGGLPIEGAINMRLLDFMDEYCTGQEVMDTHSVLNNLTGRKTNYDLDGLIDEVTMVRNKFNSVKKASKEILKYSKRVTKLKGKENKESPELNNILSKIQTLIDTVRHPSLNLLTGYNYGLELFLKRQEVQEIDDIEDKWEMLDKQLERGMVYYDQVVKTTGRFNKMLDKVLAELKREKVIDAILSDGTLKETDRFYRVGMMYKKAGIAAMAAKYLERIAGTSDIAQNDPETGDLAGFNKLYVSLAEIYMKQYRFPEAINILEAVGSLNAGIRTQDSKIMDNVESMLRVSKKKISAWEERKQMMGKILKDAESNYGSHLESGYFYFRIKDFERAEKSYLKAIETIESGVMSQESGAAYYGLAHTYLAMDDPDKAVEALEKALEFDPSNPVLYRDLGLIAAESNNLKPAEIFLLKAIELAPHEAELYKPLANLYMSMGQTEEAAALYEKALQANADIPVIQQHLAAIYNDTISLAHGRPG